MKKLLTTIFMAVLAVSAFATVNVETETPTVYHDGSCERVGSMRFIVTNIQDYQSASTTNPVVIQILLTDAATLCHDLDGIDDGINNWVSLEVDGTQWVADEVKARGAAGANYIEVRIEAAPGDGTTTPNTTDQAWFRLGSTVDMLGNPITLNVWDAADPFNNITTKADGTPICVDFTGRVNGADAFMENEFNVISLTTFQGALGGTQLGTSYSPANPAIAYGGPANVHNFGWSSNCGKGGTDFNSPDVLLCQCYVSDVVNQSTVYDCYDLYRVGVLDLDSDNCDVWIYEDSVGMLPVNSVITMTIVDAAGNPLSTVDNGVYINNASLTPMVLNDGSTAAELALSAPTWGAAHDLSTGGELSNWWYNGYVPTDGICDTSGKDNCYDNYDLYESISWTVTAESQTEAARIQVGDVNMGRFTADGPITAYVKISWSPYPCGAGGSIVLDEFPLNFVDCPPEETVTPEYYPAYEYFTFFPKFSDGYWWTGLAVTNVTYFNDTFVGGYPGQVVDQDADVVYYLIEADGDVYMLNAGTLPKSGILVTLLSDPALAPTYMGSNSAEAAFGDEPFWVVVEATPTTPWTYLAIDGFGMIGNGNEGQGTLPRTDFRWLFGAPLFNK